MMSITPINFYLTGSQFAREAQVRIGFNYFFYCFIITSFDLYVKLGLVFVKASVVLAKNIAVFFIIFILL